MKIGNIEIANDFMLAPMAGVSTQAFRKIAMMYSSGLVVTEMISDKALIYNNHKTFDMIRIAEDEHPIGIQLFGSEPEEMLAAAKIILQHSSPDFIDLNMGCPVKKVTSTGAGSALLKDPDKIYKMVKLLSDNIDIPITVKLRVGYTHDEINILEVAKLLEKAGAKALFIHGRTKSDLYTGLANWDLIKQVKEEVSIPVIGNGDIQTYQDYFYVKEHYLVDGVMIGRAALGRPWIFKEISEAKKGNIFKITKEEIINTMLLHAKLLSEEKCEKVAIVEMRTHAAWYFNNFSFSKTYKVECSQISTLAELEAIAEKALMDDKLIIKERKSRF